MKIQDIIMINKPKQMVVHPAPGHYSGTLVNALMYHCGNELSGINGCMRPGIVHRADIVSTGSLVICKNDKAHQSLSEQLKRYTLSVVSMLRSYMVISKKIPVRLMHRSDVIRQTARK